MDACYLAEAQAFLRYASLPGRDPAIVYLTGLGLSVFGTFSGGIVEPTRSTRRALLVDFLGAGASDAPESFAYTLEDHARTVAALLDAVEIRGSTVVGYSFGGSVAITLAATRPDLVGALVVIEPNLDPGGGFLSKRIADQTEAAFRESGFTQLVSEYVRRARDGSGVTAITVGMMRAVAPLALHRSAVGLVRGTNPMMRERLLGLAIPRAMIRGEASGKVRGEDELGASGVRFHVVPAAGHGMMWENPDGFVRALTLAIGS